MSKSACVDCKYAGNLAVAFGPVKLQRSWPAAIDGPPSGDPRSRKQLFKSSSQLSNYFFGTFLASSTWPRYTVHMQRIESASLFEATSAFQTFGKRELNNFCALFDVVTGHRKYAVNIFRRPFAIFRTSLRWPRDTVEMQ